MNNIRLASKSCNRWSKFFTEATTKRVKLFLMPRAYGKAYFFVERLKKPKMLKAMKRLYLFSAKHLTCSRKKIKGRGS